MNKLFSIALVLFLLTSCATKISLNSNYFNSQKKVGLIVKTNKISKSKAGSQGLLDMAITSGDKYKEPLETIEPKLVPTEKLKILYTEIFSSKMKQLIILDETIDVKTVEKFEKPNSDKKYSKTDLRYLKSKYNIDEVLLVEVNYGILVSYYGMIEIGKNGYAKINSSIIDLNDNSLVYSGISNSINKIEGEWKTPPAYESLKNSILKAIDKSIELEKTKIK